jgi:antitoxin component YwqK of YwqJK toxin-antitoxin module
MGGVIHMEESNTLDISEVWDESQRIRPIFRPRDRSGWVPHGRYTAVSENGRLLVEITYRHGVVHGSYRDYWSNGKVASEGQFEEGKQEGVWHFYNRDGTLREIIRFKQGKEIGTF